MAATATSITGPAVNYRDNLCRWDGRKACHFEVWYLTLNHRATRHGFWFRYTLLVPAAQGGLEPRAEVWAAAMGGRRAERKLVLIERSSIDAFDPGTRDRFALKIGDSALGDSSATGKVVDACHSIEWDLRFAPRDKTHHYVPGWLGKLVRPSSRICSPNLDVGFAGSVTVDGERITINDEPGCQSHLWGRKHVDEWVWTHCNAFETHPGTVFEGLAARPRKAGITLPPVMSLYLNHRGEELRFFRVRIKRQWRRKLGIGLWYFSAMDNEVCVEGAAQCRIRDAVEVEYVDPDGEPLYCLNSELGNLKVRFFRRVQGLSWRHVETISAHGTAHVEHASRRRGSS